MNRLKTYWLTSLFFIVVLSLFYLYFRNDGKNNGLVIVCGGGLEFKTGDLRAATALKDFAKSQKSSHRPKLASIQSGSPSLKDSEIYWHGEPNDPGYDEIFNELGFDPFFVPLTIDNVIVQNEREIVDRVASADVVFLNGGDQIRHARALLTENDEPSPMLLAIKSVIKNGGSVIGTSAGTHVAGEVLFGGGISEGALRSNSVYALPKGSNSLAVPGDTEEVLSSYGTGIGLIRGILLDSHSSARGRVGRLLVALSVIKRDGFRPTPIGFGIDENTCLFWNDKFRQGTVYGEGRVWVLDITNAATAEAADKKYYARNVEFAFASHGDQVVLSDGRTAPNVRILSSRHKIDIPREPKSLLPSELFGKGPVGDWFLVSENAQSNLYKDNSGIAGFGFSLNVDLPLSNR